MSSTTKGGITLLVMTLATAGVTAYARDCFGEFKGNLDTCVGSFGPPGKVESDAQRAAREAALKTCLDGAKESLQSCNKVVEQDRAPGPPSSSANEGAARDRNLSADLHSFIPNGSESMITTSRAGEPATVYLSTLRITASNRGLWQISLANGLPVQGAAQRHRVEGMLRVTSLSRDARILEIPFDPRQFDSSMTVQLEPGEHELHIEMRQADESRFGVLAAELRHLGH